MQNSLSCSRSQPRITSCSWAGVRNWTASSASVSRCQAERFYTIAHSLRPHSDPMATPHLTLTHASSYREQPVCINDTVMTNTHTYQSHTQNNKALDRERNREIVCPAQSSLPERAVCSLKRSSLKIQKLFIIVLTITIIFLSVTPLKSAAHISPTLFRGEKRKESHNKTEGSHEKIEQHIHTLWLFLTSMKIHINAVIHAQVNLTKPVRNMSGSYFTSKSKEGNEIYICIKKIKPVFQTINLFCNCDIIFMTIKHILLHYHNVKNYALFKF